MTSKSDDPGPKSKHIPRGAPEPEPKALTGVYNLWLRPMTGRVLVIESDPDIARMLEVRLAREGHEVALAETGAEATRIMERDPIDIVMLDRQLPDMSGMQLLGHIKEHHKPVEVLVLTVDPTIDTITDALELGAFDLLIKPFSNLKLVMLKVKTAVSKVRAERDRDELARMLHAQTQDLVLREKEAEQKMEMDIDESLNNIDFDSMSGVDPLTGLPNRRSAEDRFRKEASRALRYDRPLCVALASIDNLEHVIEKHGIDVADGVLRGISSMFSGMVRDVDFVARRQGGEFMFLFPETPKDAGFVVLERIRHALDQTSFSETVGQASADEEKFHTSASFGIAALPTDTMNIDLLRDAAEAALARARTTGNAVVLFEPSMVQR